MLVFFAGVTSGCCMLQDMLRPKTLEVGVGKGRVSKRGWVGECYMWMTSSGVLQVAWG